MTIARIKLQTSTFTDGPNSSESVIDRRKLIGEYFTRGDATTALRNRANPSAPAVFVGAGSPIFSADSVILSGHASLGGGVAGMDLQIKPPRDMTYIAIRKIRSGGNAGSTVPWMGADNAIGLSEYSTSPTGWNFFNNQINIPPLTSKITAPVGSDFYFVAGTGKDGKKGTIHLGGSGLITSNEGTGLGSIKPGSTSSIKIVPNGLFYAAPFCYIAVYAGALSLAEITAEYLRLKTWHATLGITVS